MKYFNKHQVFQLSTAGIRQQLHLHIDVNVEVSKVLSVLCWHKRDTKHTHKVTLSCEWKYSYCHGLQFISFRLLTHVLHNSLTNTINTTHIPMSFQTKARLNASSHVSNSMNSSKDPFVSWQCSAHPWKKAEILEFVELALEWGLDWCCHISKESLEQSEEKSNWMRELNVKCCESQRLKYFCFNRLAGELVLLQNR